MAKEIILVVDDEIPARNAVTRLLQERGYTVHAVGSGQEAINFASHTPFDVLLTDFRMPGGLDGLTTVRATRLINPQVVAIIMTGHSSIELAVQSLNLGVHGFVIKPFTAFELTHTIEQTISQQNLMRENMHMRALVDLFSITQALLTGRVEPSRLPPLALEQMMNKVPADNAYLFLCREPTVEGIEAELELDSVVQREAHENGVADELFFPDLDHYRETNRAALAELKKWGLGVMQLENTLMLVDGASATTGTPTLATGDVCHLLVPLLAQGRRIGVLILERKKGHELAFSEVEVQTASILASQAAIALENSRLFRSLARMEALYEADRLRSEFVAMISHELRTPLTSIKGYATTLLRPDVQWNNQTGTEYLSIISEECDKLMQLIDNILEVSKIEAGALRIFPEPIQIGEVVVRAVTEARRRSPEAVVEMDVPPAESVPFVFADAQRIIQVLRNLIQNGLKYSPRNPHLVVAVEYLPDGDGRGESNAPMVQVGVNDNGVGLAPEVKPRIFERFFRVDTGPARRTEGTGLGLAICRGIVEAHNGHIWVESAGLERGSTFYFTLPVADLSRPIDLD